MMEKKISLLVSTYNWNGALEMCLLSLFAQTQRPLEIVIADDGSTDDTRQLIDRLRAKSPVPIVHVWQEDVGFRRCKILNKAIAQCRGEYIIQIDGDVVLEKHFIQDHTEIAEPHYFVCGSRVLLDQKTTRRLMDGDKCSPNLFSMPLGFVMNSLRSRVLRRYLAKRYGQKRIDHLRGCNMAFWKSDIVAINGYNEDLTQWGHEDGELGFRLHFYGVGKKSLKMGGVCYHLFHKRPSNANEGFHLKVLEKVKAEKSYWTANGIRKYLE